MYIIEAISRQHLRDRFDCGQPPLNEYLLRYARQNDDNNIAKAFVAVDDDNRVLGYYCISSASVEFKELPEDIVKGLPHYPVPAALIGRLACDKSIQGKGLGARLYTKGIMDCKQVIFSGHAVRRMFERAVSEQAVRSRHIGNSLVRGHG